MTGLTLSLTAVLLLGVALTVSLFTTKAVIDKRKFAGTTRQQVSRAVPLWRSFLALLGPAAIVFAVHALLVIHGKVN